MSRVGKTKRRTIHLPFGTTAVCLRMWAKADSSERMTGGGSASSVVTTPMGWTWLSNRPVYARLPAPPWTAGTERYFDGSVWTIRCASGSRAAIGAW